MKQRYIAQRTLKNWWTLDSQRTKLLYIPYVAKEEINDEKNKNKERKITKLDYKKVQCM